MSTHAYIVTCMCIYCYWQTIEIIEILFLLFRNINLKTLSIHVESIYYSNINGSSPIPFYQLIHIVKESGLKAVHQYNDNN